jgi:hypothetical protein
LNDDAGTPEEAKKKVDMLLAKLKSGAQFAPLAMDYSEDPASVDQGGDLGFHPASDFARAPQAIKDAVLNGQPGSLNMVSANGAYTIVLLVAHEPAGQRELSSPAVHDGIRNMLQQRKEQLLRVAYLTVARNQAKIENHLAESVVNGQAKAGAAATTPSK